MTPAKEHHMTTQNADGTVKVDAKTVGCPTCFASVGYPCTTKGPTVLHKRVTRTHPSRVRAAKVAAGVCVLSGLRADAGAELRASKPTLLDAVCAPENAGKLAAACSQLAAQASSGLRSKSAAEVEQLVAGALASVRGGDFASAVWRLVDAAGIAASTLPYHQRRLIAAVGGCTGRGYQLVDVDVAKGIL